MQSITLRIISGADRGKTYHELKTPITIGREEGNNVQLNDERVSRYHVKIQEDDGRLVITDLESTNGTRVSGQTCNLAILRLGDTISIGRTVLVLGSKEEVYEWMQNDLTRSGKGILASSSDNNIDVDNSTGLARPDSNNPPPREIGVPKGLTPGQAAELRELLDHLHRSLSYVLDNPEVDEKENTVSFELRSWQRLIMTQSEISELIRHIEDPPNSSQAGSDTGAE
ncbi:MAG: FHA domain-containing protein [Pirellulaceae bacterium]